MKNRKLNQLLVASVISAAMMTSAISVNAADFSDDTSAAAEQTLEAGEDETPDFEDASESVSDAAEAASTVAVNATNFPDAKFRQYVLDNIDTNKDKKLSAAEIKAAKTIDVSGLGVSNLKGIERFTYATDLFAANNKLKSVDITKNTKIAYLNLSNNSLTGTLNLSKCTNLHVVKYGSNKLTKVTMPAKKYLKNLDFVDASSNKFTTQANAGLNIGDTDYVKNLSEVNASNNAITSFNCAGFQGILDLRNNKITTLKLENSKEGSQVVSLYIDGNILSNTPSVDFTPEWITVPQQFSCDAKVSSKVKMLKAKASITSSTWDQIVVNVGSSTDDASYKLEKKKDNGAYETVKTWENGDLADAEFGEDYTDNVISTGAAYTYRVTATAQIKDANKNLRSWSNSVEVKATAIGAKPALTLKSTKKGVATVSWKAVAGADGYDVYCGSSKKSQKGTVVKGTTALTANKTGLTSGKTYYFRARAYKMVGSNKVYTGYSAVKSIKVK